MDSPERSKSAAAAAAAGTPAAAAASSVSESAAVEESPVFNFINNLSPIGPVKTGPVVQDYPGINSPPLVFTSPKVNSKSQYHWPQLCSEHGAGSSNKRLSRRLVPCTNKLFYNSSVQEQAESRPICVDDFLVDAVDSKNSSLQKTNDSIGTNEPADLKDKEIKITDGTAMVAPSGTLAPAEEDHEGKTSVDIQTFEPNANRDDEAGSDPSSKMQFDSSLDIALQNQYDTCSTIEAGEHRGIFRRCLQFEDVQQKTTVIADPCNFSLSVNCPKSAVSPIASEAVEPFSLNKPTTQKSRQLSVTQNTENSSLRTPKPSGIGLHLNSIVNTVQSGCSATLSMEPAERGNFSVQGKKSMPMITYRHSEKSKKCLISSNVGEDILAKLEESNSQGENSVSVLLHSVKPMDIIASLKPMECQSTPDDKRKSSSENFDESSQSSPKKKRKKTSDAGDGCKRCNCKKSKCLKLYCDCFAAGDYCAELCACQGCFNRPDYEDTVLETRQQIESRNPLAFAPKVVPQMTDSHSNNIVDNGVSFTPSSARHKRGCNCKKSMCLKKYCECYQANVGCSSGCRCEGCRNVYGQKEEYGRIKNLVKTIGAFEQTELSNPHNLTPMTPSFQHSDHRHDASKSWFPSGRCSQSPETGHTVIPHYEMSKRFAEIPDNPSIQENSDFMDLVSFDQEMENNNPTTVTELSQVDMNQLIVLPNSQQYEHLYPGTHHLPSASSFPWRSSPITPMLRYDSKGLVESGLSDNSSFNAIEDETPEILKDSSTPPHGVKVSSPNKKRVSPPHERMKDSDGSSSARRLKAGRKYKLGSVPSFPPLTPCFDSKGSSVGQNTDDPQKPSSDT